jgi:hypothetical protein
VFHCHILRHEDRGMMSMVAATPMLRSLGEPENRPAYWYEGSKELRVFDDHGTIRVYLDTGVTHEYDYKGVFNEGIGNEFQEEPWLGSMNFAPRATPPKSVPFCASFEGRNEKPVEIVFADGTSWSRGKTQDAPGGAPPTGLAGVWKADDSGIKVTIEETVGTDGTSLRFEPESRAWWKRATGSWKNKNAYQYQGSVTFTDANEQRTQKLTFCVKADLNTMVFGNGSRWRRVPN